MITRRDVLTASAGIALSAAYRAPTALAQPLARTAYILTGFSPGLQDAMARLVAGQMVTMRKASWSRPGRAQPVALRWRR